TCWSGQESRVRCTVGTVGPAHPARSASPGPAHPPRAQRSATARPPPADLALGPGRQAIALPPRRRPTEGASQIDEAPLVLGHGDVAIGRRIGLEGGGSGLVDDE